jgi:divalent metal cation (Fe/Co/Zn/Cd) transporter
MASKAKYKSITGGIMEGTLFDTMIAQFPSLTGLLVAILILWQVVKNQDKRIDRLTEALIKAENCKEPE